MDDTNPRIRALQFDIYRRMSAWDKVLLIDEMRRIERMLAKTGLRSRHPELSEDEIELRVNAMFLGPELAARVYGSGRTGTDR